MCPFVNVIFKIGASVSLYPAKTAPGHVNLLAGQVSAPPSYMDPTPASLQSQRNMASSPASSDLSDPPSVESDADMDDSHSTPAASARLSMDMNAHTGAEPPAKRRKTGPSSTLNTFEAPTPHPEGDDDDDNISISSDGYSSAPGSDNEDEWALKDQAQTQCLWRDCDFGTADNNDDLVKHVQGTHCATGGPKKTKYVCEWGECQRKASNHPSGYALKAHMRSHTKEKPYYCALPGLLPANRAASDVQLT